MRQNDSECTKKVPVPWLNDNCSMPWFRKFKPVPRPERCTRTHQSAFWQQSASVKQQQQQQQQNNKHQR